MCVVCCCCWTKPRLEIVSYSGSSPSRRGQACIKSHLLLAPLGKGKLPTRPCAFAAVIGPPVRQNKHAPLAVSLPDEAHSNGASTTRARMAGSRCPQTPPSSCCVIHDGAWGRAFPCFILSSTASGTNTAFRQRLVLHGDQLLVDHLQPRPRDSLSIQ